MHTLALYCYRHLAPAQPRTASRLSPSLQRDPHKPHEKRQPLKSPHKSAQSEQDLLLMSLAPHPTACRPTKHARQHSNTLLSLQASFHADAHPTTLSSQSKRAAWLASAARTLAPKPASNSPASQEIPSFSASQPRSAKPRTVPKRLRYTTEHKSNHEAKEHGLAPMSSSQAVSPPGVSKPAAPPASSPLSASYAGKETQLAPAPGAAQPSPCHAEAVAPPRIEASREGPTATTDP